MPKDPAKDRAELRETDPEVDDDVETAQTKSGSVDERVPEHLGSDDATGIDAPAPAAHLPQAGVGVPRAVDEMGPGEAVLNKEREHLRIRKRPG